MVQAIVSAGINAFSEHASQEGVQKVRAFIQRNCIVKNGQATLGRHPNRIGNHSKRETQSLSLSLGVAKNIQPLSKGNR